MKVQGLRMKNFMCHKTLEIAANGRHVTILGANGRGKSVCLAALQAAIGDKRNLPAEPILRGETKGFVELDLGDLQIDLDVKEDRSVKLVVTGKDGAVLPDSRKLLDRLFGGSTLRADLFCDLSESERMAELVRGVDFDFAAEAAERKRLYDERTGAGRDIRKLEGALAALPHHPDAPATEVSLAELLAQRQELARQEAQREADERELERLRVLVRDAKAKSASLSAQVEALTVERNHCRDEIRVVAAGCRTRLAAIETESNALEFISANAGHLATLASAIREAADKAIELGARIDEVEVDIDKVVAETEAKTAEGRALAERLRSHAIIDTAELDRQILDVQATNERVRVNAERRAKTLELEVAKAEQEALSRGIAEIDERVRKACEAVSIPEVGLTVEDGAIRLYGAPWNQASDGQRLKASAAVLMRRQPQLKVLYFARASLLDAAARKSIEAFASERQYQIWWEITADEGELSITIEEACDES